MGGAGRRWRGGLLVAVIAGQVGVGCAARGRVPGPADAGGPEGTLGAGEGVSVTAGEGRVRVTRDGFAGAWVDEAGRCTREMAGPVAVQTLGVGLIVLPGVCGVMTAVLPGLTTHFRGGQTRRGIESLLAHRDLHATLRDGIAAAVPDTGRAPGAILEVTVTELRVRDDGTLSSVAARARLLRAGDRRELVSRGFTHKVAARAPWFDALEPALATLSATILEAMVPVPPVATMPGPEGGGDP